MTRDEADDITRRFDGVSERLEAERAAFSALVRRRIGTAASVRGGPGGGRGQRVRSPRECAS